MILRPIRERIKRQRSHERHPVTVSINDIRKDELGIDPSPVK